MTLCFFGLINEEWIFKNGQWISRDENKEEIPEGMRVGIQRFRCSSISRSPRMINNEIVKREVSVARNGISRK